MTITCRYCHAVLPHHVSTAAHYATCAVLSNCLAPAAPRSSLNIGSPSNPRHSEAERAARANQYRDLARARARLKAEKHH